MAIDDTVDEMFELTSAIQRLTAALLDNISGTTEHSDALKADLKTMEERLKRDKVQAAMDAKNTETKQKLGKSTEDLKESFKQLGRELLAVGREGIKFGQTIGVSATKGVDLEIRNRNTIVKQLSNFSDDLVVTSEQLKTAQSGFADAFVGVAEGMQMSSEGTRSVLASLKTGFKSEFEPTAETFRVLTQMGMSTTAQFDEFRRATGRASLSNNQLTSLYNKNQLSFLLYGNSFGKAAVQAERLGINLASVQAAQEGLVTNLDGTIDTVAQMNQLGANIDFGNLVRIAEQEGPDALMAYVRATVPEQLMQSASTRSLFKQLGISVEDYMKSGQKQESAADQLEQQMSETATSTSAAADTITSLTRVTDILMGSWGGLITATFGVITSLVVFSFALIAASARFGVGGALGIAGKALTGFGGLMAGMGPILMAVGVALGLLALAAGGLMQVFSGRKMVEEGKVGQGTTRGALGGALTGAAIGTMIAPGVGTVIGAGIGALAGGAYAYSAKPANDMYSAGFGNRTLVTQANDMYSAGYGSRTLITPTGAYALNNADDIVAGTKLFSEGSLKASAGSDNSDLIKKVDNLITVLSNATTTINVGGTTQQVPRIQLVGVYSRNER